MDRANTRNVEAMYSGYPYPSPIVGDSLIHDVCNLFKFIFSEELIANKKILDAGCGTGHRLIQLAKTYAQSHFSGIDLTERSLTLASQLAKKHHVDNVNFEKIDLLNFKPREKYDIILSTGVIVALENPLLGLMNLTRCLNKDGYILLWLYHPYGEFNRLLHRDLVFSFMNNEDFNLEEGVQIINDFGVDLSDKLYGASAAQSNKQDVSQLEINVDAYLHPIVNTYRFSESFELINKCGMDWVSVNSINMENNSMLIDLSQVADDDLANFCIRNKMFLPSSNLMERYKRMSMLEKYKVIELFFKPNGFVVMAGYDQSFLKLSEITRGSVIKLADQF